MEAQLAERGRVVAELPDGRLGALAIEYLIETADHFERIFVDVFQLRVELTGGDIEALARKIPAVEKSLVSFFGADRFILQTA